MVVDVQTLAVSWLLDYCVACSIIPVLTCLRTLSCPTAAAPGGSDPTSIEQGRDPETGPVNGARIGSPAWGDDPAPLSVLQCGRVKATGRITRPSAPQPLKMR